MQFHVVLLSFFLLIAFSQAVDYCVGPTATGNADGSDWNNQIGGFPPSPRVRGARYLFAAGKYYLANGEVSLDDEESGTLWIDFVRATEDDHGSDAGWDSDLCGEPVEFLLDDVGTEWGTTPFLITRSYYSFDGRGMVNEQYGFIIGVTDLTCTTPESASLENIILMVIFFFFCYLLSSLMTMQLIFMDFI